MAIRTDITEVRLTITTPVVDGRITQFIRYANNIVNQGVSLSSAFAALGVTVLADLETMLAAHYVAWFADPRAREEENGKTRRVWQGQTGMDFKATPYGQMALSSDPTGTLVAIAKGSTGSIPAQVLGPG